MSNDDGAQTTMRAARVRAYGGSDQIEVTDVPRPLPSKGEILVRIAAAGVNPLDWKMREGNFAPPPPFTAGEDLAGTVAAVGDGVTAFETGDEVYAMLGMDRPGAYAEYAVGPVEWFALRPNSLTAVEAAGVPMGAITAWKAIIEVGSLREGQRLLVHGGAGAVGSMAVQIAKAKGAWVAATASGSGVAKLHDMGVDLAIDYKSERFEDVAAEVGGVDLVLDTLAGETRDRSWVALRDDGAVVSTLGETQPPAGFEARRLRGLPGFGAAPDGQLLSGIGALIDAGKIRPLIDQVMPLERAAEAMDLNQQGKAKGRIIIVMSEQQ